MHLAVQVHDIVGVAERDDALQGGKVQAQLLEQGAGDVHAVVNEPVELAQAFDGQLHAVPCFVHFQVIDDAGQRGRRVVPIAVCEVTEHRPASRAAGEGAVGE